MDRFDPFVKYADVYGDIINWEKDPMNKPQNQNKYFFSDGKTYYEQICKMLRLMSVFKEAFNQIYSNEDEISEAWENFVNNLSASVVEGSEPDVTLTWTDDSVNFEFTMVPGVPGEQGVGITSISFNSDYTMTITLSDGNTYTSMSLKGETGPQGPQGETGSGLQILDVYATLADLQSAHPTGQPGDAYQVGSAGNYTLYIWSSSQSAWVPAGTLGTVSPYTSAPLMDGTASAGSQNLYARGDHVHPTDTSRASKEELDALIKTSQSMIDQSFTYRESPAIQDGLARFDKIKGNTLVWNQLAELNSGSTNNCTKSFDPTTGATTITPSNYSSNFVGLYNLISSDYLIAGHKYLVSLEVKPTSNLSVLFGFDNNLMTKSLNANTFQTLSVLQTRSSANVLIYGQLASSGWTSGTFQIKNVQCFDLTRMGLDSITDPSDFTSLFSLPYYDFNQGSLLSFNGNGIKTVGKNLANPNSFVQGIIDVQSGNVGANPSWITSPFISVLDATSVTVQGWKDSTEENFMVRFTEYDSSYNIVQNTNNINISAVAHYQRKVTLNANTKYIRFSCGFNNRATTPQTFFAVNRVMLEFGGTASSYEAYQEDTLSLPTQQYFPTGMKSAGSVYDELTESKAITRIGAVDLGSLEWGTSNTATQDIKRMQATALRNVISKPSSASVIANVVCTNYTAVSADATYLKTVGLAIDSAGNILIYDPNYNTSASTEAFKQAMSGVYLYYELSTPIETAVDLDLDFMAYEDGTEQLLPVNGSAPATSPIIADMTYLSIDDAMEYIIDKLANVPQNTQQILESLEDDVADLQTDTGALQTAVSGLQTSVGNINTNIGQLSSTVAGHTASISDMQSDITDLNTDLGDLSDTVTDHTSSIGTLESGLSTTNGNVQNLETSVSDLDDTVTAQGTTVTAIDSIIQDISNNPVVTALGSHELGFVAAYVEATLAANAGTRVTIPKPVIFPNNYTPLFIVGMSTGSSDVSICEIPPTFGSRDSVSCRVWNHGSQQTVQVTVYILCMRQRQSQ